MDCHGPIREIDREKETRPGDEVAAVIGHQRL
jgi:hypothetical protein